MSDDDVEHDEADERVNTAMNPSIEAESDAFVHYLQSPVSICSSQLSQVP